jgi:hypothetical protein
VSTLRFTGVASVVILALGAVLRARAGREALRSILADALSTALDGRGRAAGTR